MFKALLYKEWIKLRLYWSLLLVTNLVFCGFLCFRIRHMYQLHDAVMIWSNWLSKGFLFYRSCHFVPLLLGIVLGCLQFFPEKLNKRLRLVLHLPLSEERSVSVHLLAGLLLLTAMLVPGLALIALTGAHYFPPEFQSNLWLTAAPWLLAGYAGYLLTAFNVLEPTWRLRIVGLLFSAALLKLFYLDDFYNAYFRVLSGAALWTAGLFLLPLLSTHRFGKGYGS
jgi:hypothetical protein